MVHGGRVVTTAILVAVIFVSAVQCMEKPEKVKAPRNITRTSTRHSSRHAAKNSTKSTRSTSEPSEPGPTAAATRVPPVTYSAAPIQQTALAPTADPFSQSFVNSPYAAQFMPGALDLSSFFHPQFTGTTQHHGLDLDSLYAEYNAQYGGSQSLNTPLPDFSSFYNTPPPPATAPSIKQANRQPVYYQTQRQPTPVLTNYNTIRPSQRQPAPAEYASTVYTPAQRQPGPPQRPPMAIYSSYYQSQRQPTPAEYASVYQQSPPQTVHRGPVRGSPPPPTVDYNTLIRSQQAQSPKQQQIDLSAYYAQQQQQQLHQQQLQQLQQHQQQQQQQQHYVQPQRVPQGRPQQGSQHAVSQLSQQQVSQGPVKIDVKTLISNHVLPQIKGAQGIQLLDLSEFYGPQGPPGQGQSQAPQGAHPTNFFQLTPGGKQPELTLSPEQLAYYQQQAQAAGPAGSAANPTLSPEQLSAYYKESGHTDPRVYQKLQQQQQSGRPESVQSPQGPRPDSSHYQQQQSARPEPINVHVHQQQQSSKPDPIQYQVSYQGVRPTPTVYIQQGGQQQVVYQQHGGRPETVYQGRPDLSAYQGARDPSHYQQAGPPQGQHPDVAGLSPNELKSLYAQFALQTQGAQGSQTSHQGSSQGPQQQSVPANHHPSYQGVDLTPHYRQQHVGGPATTGVVYVSPGSVSLGPLDPRGGGPTATPSAAEEPTVRQPSATLAALASYFQHQQQQQQGSAGPSGYTQGAHGPLVNGYQQTSPNYYASTAVAAPNPVRGGSSGRPQQLTHISSPLPTAAAPSPTETSSKPEKTRQLVKKPHSFGQGYSFEISG